MINKNPGKYDYNTIFMPFLVLKINLATIQIKTYKIN